MNDTPETPTEAHDSPPIVDSPPTLALGAVQLELGGAAEDPRWFIYYESRPAPERVAVVGLLLPDAERDAQLQSLRIVGRGRPVGGEALGLDGRSLLQLVGAAPAPIVLEAGEALAVRVDASTLGDFNPRNAESVSPALRPYLQLGSILFQTADAPPLLEQPS